MHILYDIIVKLNKDITILAYSTSKVVHKIEISTPNSAFSFACSARDTNSLQHDGRSYLSQPVW